MWIEGGNAKHMCGLKGGCTVLLFARLVLLFARRQPHLREYLQVLQPNVIVARVRRILPKRHQQMHHNGCYGDCVEKEAVVYGLAVSLEEGGGEDLEVALVESVVDVVGGHVQPPLVVAYGNVGGVQRGAVACNVVGSVAVVGREDGMVEEVGGELWKAQCGGG